MSRKRKVISNTLGSFMNKFMRYPVKLHPGLLAVFACALLCGGAGIIKVGPPLYRTVARHMRLRQARAEWQSIMRGGQPSEDSPLCNLEVPSVALDIPVLAESSRSNLSRLPCVSATCVDFGHAPVIVAHRDLHFRELQGVEVGDSVYLTQRSGERAEYHIQSIHVVLPEMAERMAAAVSRGSLMLVTCFPFRYLGPAPERYVVVCEH
jgi:sortase A